jgi:putative transposase
VPIPFASCVGVSSRQKTILLRLSRSRRSPAVLVERSTLLLLASEGKTSLAIAKELGMNRQRVRRWRNRWSEELSVRLNAMEAVAEDAVLSIAIEEALSDRPRSGTPPKFTAAQEEQIRAMACREPSEFGLPHSQWTRGLLARIAQERGIVESVSVAEIGRWLKKGGSSRTGSATG